MNTQRILQLADHIEALPSEQFNMELPSCCICGHARSLFACEPDDSRHAEISPTASAAAQALDIPPELAEEIFYKFTIETKEQAAAFLRNLAAGTL